MSTLGTHHFRTATTADAAQLLRLWALLFEEAVDASGTMWKRHAREWFLSVANASDTARFPVVDVGGEVVATAIGTLEVGVPNPQCARGREGRISADSGAEDEVRSVTCWTSDKCATC